MKTFRMVSSLLILTLLLGLAPAVFAQDQTFGLSQGDLDTLNTAVQATASAKSGQFSFTANIATTGESDPTTINANGTGTWDKDAQGTPLVQVQLGGQMSSGTTADSPINAEVRSISGTVYVNSPMLGVSQWLMLTPKDAQSAMSMMGNMLPMNPQTLGMGGQQAGQGQGIQNLASQGIGGLFANLGDVNPAQYVHIVRNGDRFTTTVDLIGLLSAPEFQDYVVQQQVAAQAALNDNDDATPVNEEELRQQAAQLPAALQGSTLTVDEYVTNGTVSRFTLNLALMVDPVPLNMEGGPSTVNAMIDVNLSGFNQPHPVTAPTDTITLADLFAQMFQGLNFGADTTSANG